MAVAIVFKIICIVILVFVMILYLLSKNKYVDFVNPVDEKEFKFKKLIPAGLYVIDKIKYKFSTRYDRNIFYKISEIYGAKYALYYTRIFYANKFGLLLLAISFAAFIGIVAEFDWSIAFFGLMITGAAFYASDQELKKKVDKRRLSMRLDFPDFINKLLLLVNAGMTMSKAWEKVTLDNKKQTPLYNELEVTMTEIRGGKSEIQAYEDFAKRCRIPEITKFVSVIIQNVRKGSYDLVPVLRLRADECWTMRKHAAMRLGEEASTKMLLPMMIMFGAILIIVGMPALLLLWGVQ